MKIIMIIPEGEWVLGYLDSDNIMTTHRVVDLNAIADQPEEPPCRNPKK